MNDMQTFWVERAKELADKARELFPHDTRLEILLEKACTGNDRAYDTLYWLSQGFAHGPNFPGS